MELAAMWWPQNLVHVSLFRYFASYKYLNVCVRGHLFCYKEMNFNKQVTFKSFLN